MRAQQNTGNLSKNQDRLIHWTQQVLRPKGWDEILDRLKAALKVANVNDAARKAIGILKEIGVHQLLIVVDEIEDISDVDLDGLPDDERKAIKQELLTVIPRVIKSEEDRQQFPNVKLSSPVLARGRRSIAPDWRDQAAYGSVHSSIKYIL